MVSTGLPNCEVYAARLADPNLDIPLKNTIIRELRESFDVYQSSNYAHVLLVLFPVFRDILLKQSPVFVSNAPEQKLRSAILEIIHRFPLNETLKPYVDDILQICLQLIRTENEDNAVLCLKILVELHRSYKNALEKYVQRFLDTVKEIYRNVGASVRDVFEGGETPGPVTPFANPFASPRPMSPLADASDATNKPLTKSMWSFKVLSECPVIVVMLCQAYRKYNADNMPTFIPLIVDTLKLRVRQQEEASQAAEAQQQTFVGMSPTIKNRTSYLELIIAQVKTLSFLAFSLRNFSKAIQPYKQDLPTIVIHLLQDCPSEAASTRRELLIALRHILATDLRTAFVSKIDVLLSAEILIGRGVTSRETLRSIAFSTLADLVHHIRADLSPTQLARAVRMYADNLHDTTLASGIQSMSAKLLINLIDCIVAIPDKSVARQLLMQIFTTFTYKLESLSVQFVRVEHQYHQKSEALAQPADDNSTTTTDSSPVTWSVGSTAEQYFAIQLGSSDSHGDFVKETRFLIKNLVSGIKHAVFVLKHCNPPPPTGVSNLQEYNAVARGFTTNEMGIFVSLFRAGVRCFNYYGLSGASTTDDHGNSSSNSTATTLTVGKGAGAGAGGPGKFSTGSKEEKELLEHFASVFIYVDPAIFQEVFLSQMEFLFEMTLQNTPLITVPQFFLASDAVSQSFASICLAFLMKRMDQLGGDDTHYTSVMVQLFKLVFMAVTLFPNTNEAVLKPHIGHIITSCLKLSGKARNPADYFHLLRALFRSIGGGRFEMLYKEVLPLLQMLLETLNMLLATTHERRMRELFVEICLTVPVRLSVLLPYLSLLMRPLVLALEPGSELVGQGLRTLELCIDNLTQEFLDPIMTPVINGIMAALWKHLRPEPYDQNLSHTTVRILGKLGGRNRRMFQSFPKLQHCVPVKPALALSLALHGVDKPQVLPLEDGLRVATKVLEDPTVEFYYKEKALTLVTAQLALLVDWSGVTTSGLYQLRAWFQRIASREQGNGDASGPGPELAGGGAATDELSSMTIRRTIHGLHGESQAAAVLSSFQATQRSLKAQEEALAAVIYTLFSAATDVGLRERALDLIEQVVRYFAVWHATQFCSSLDNLAEDLKPDPDTPAATFANGVSSGSETVTNYHAFVEALVRVLTAQSDDINHLGERALHLFYGTTKVLLNASTAPSPLPTLRGLLANRDSDPAVPSADMEVDEASGSSDDASFSLVARLPLFQELAQRFCSCCYMEDFVKKLGGCRGIHVLAIQLPLGRNWLLTRIVDFTKALLYILKDSATTEHYGKSSHVDQTTQTLFQVMRACWEHNQLPPALDSDDAKPTPADGLAMEVDSVEPKPTEPAKPLDPDSTNTPKPDPADGEQQVTSPIAIGSAPPTTDVQSPQSPVPKPSASAGASPQPSLPKSDTNAGEPTLAKPTAPDAQANPATTNPGATIPGPDLSMSQETEFWRARFNSLIVLLITELTNPNNNVRQAVRECFQLLAELTHRQVSQLLTPVRERLLRPIFAKPLRALSTHMQIGNIDAITYCLSLRPPLLNISEALVRLLNEALALADAEDQALASRAPPMKCSGSLTSLRLVCLQLLATAMGSPEFMSSRQSLIQARIISVFFKSLYSKTPEIVDVANKGLKQVLTQLPKLPKELLQTGLRPILMSLSDHRRLSVHGLEALARMLELLTNYFKAEIGRKLLDHLNQLATPAMLLEASSRPLQDIEPIKVIVSILNIFHLLPPSAKIFLPELVTVTLQMESHLRRNVSSPFRPPLLKFLNHYPEESVVFFLNRLTSAPHCHLFTSILQGANGATLRAELMKQPERMVTILRSARISLAPSDSKLTDEAMAAPSPACRGESVSAVGSEAKEASDKATETTPAVSDKPTGTEAGSEAAKLDPKDMATVVLRSLHLVKTISQHRPQWLLDNRAVLDHWLAVVQLPLMHEKQRQCRDQPTVQDVLDLRAVVDTFMSVIRHDPHSPELVFDLLRFCTPCPAFDVVTLRQFFWESVCLSFPAACKLTILTRFLALLTDVAAESEFLVRALRLVINPMLTASLRGNAMDPVLSEGVVDQITAKVWNYLPNGLTQEQRHRLSDTFIVEILQFTALIVAYAPYTMVEAKKTVILFAWNFIKQDDLTTKHAAYVLLARFIAAFETPSKICVQIYVALLRAHQTEVRNLVRQALDCMTPVLPQRLPATSGDGQLSTWIRWTKKILVEDGHSVSQMVNVYQLLIRHSDLFFDHCEQFFPHVVSALTKLGLLQSVTTEIRQLTIDLADLVLSWERKRLGVALPTSPPDAAMEVDLPSAHASSPHVPQKRPRPTDDESVASPTPAGKPKPSSAAPNHYAPPLFLRESVINYLVRFICYTNESSNRVGLIPRALVILKELLAPELWGDIQIRLSHFERSLLHSDITDSTLATVCHNLEVLTILVDRATPAWLGQQLSTLCQLLDKAVHSDNLAVVKALFPILGRLYSCLEQGGEAMDEDAVQTFKLTMDTIVNEGFQNTSNLFGALMILEVKGRAKAESLDPFIPALVKLVQKLTREHIDHPQTSTLSASGANVSTAAKKPLPTTVTPPGISHMVPTLVVDSPPDSPLNLLILTLNLLKVRISYLGDQRRWYLTSLISLMENSQSVELLTSILTIVSEWVLDPQNLFPTIKEKANLLVTMISVEKRQDRGLTEAYLQLVEKIYDDPAFARSELTVRLEQAFLLGTCFPNPALRDRFYAILNRSIPVTLPVRLSYVIHMQNWESLGSYFWIQQALIILLGAVITTHPLAAPTSAVRTPSITTLSPWLHADAMDTDPPVLPIHSPPTHAAESDGFAQLTTALMSFVYTLRSHTLQDVIVPFTQLIYLDDELAANLWKDLFPVYWACMTSKQRHDLTKSLTFLLIKPYHRLQAHARPNVIQTMLDGLLHCQPMPRLSPQLIKYLGKCFNAWHSALLILEKLLADTPPENPEDMEEDKVRGSMLDSLAELYWTLDEHDYFFGLWRRRASYMETNTALSYEQADVWDQAQAVYEKAQTRARKGGLPFTESEYCLWEDHWIRATQKLQQWDILMDLAKQDNNADLQLECAWRLWDWSVESPAVSQLLDACPERQSARHQLYQSFLLLIQAQKDKKIMDEFAKACNEGIQRSLQLWHALPANIGPAHTGHLHLFQLYVELQEAQQMYASLESTTATNVEAKSHELKTSLQTWRERLPNAWDDIQLWSDMVAWRQHMFTAINKTYLPLIPAITAKVGAGTNVNAGATSFAYRGYHETAWIINRFARVARKHKLLDVCVDSLKKIYTLPNIEIQEAFLKLKEQAECYYENPAEWTTGLDAINNTNLIYFNGTQKAEFFALKGMFLAKLQSPNEAKGAFSEAIQSDMASGQAWAAWGHFNDRMFRETPSNIVWGTHALSCYLHAAGIYKNAQSRRFIARILWLLSMDDTTGAMAKVFESYKGEMSVWYWNTFIPQLLTGLLQREAPICRQVLIHIAKLFPQAIHYHVRTAREEMLVLKRQAIMASSSAANDSSVPSNPTAAKDQPPPSPAESGGTPTKPAPDGASSGATAAAGSSDAGKPLQPWNHVEEIMRVLKTAFPLSGASIETMVEQIYNRLKPTTEEEIYRLLMALLNDAVQQLNLRLSHGVTNMTLTAATEANLKKFADNMTPPLLKEAFVRDFLTDKLTLDPYIERLRIWRDRFEYLIDRRPTRQPLERFSHYLVEFEYQKYDEIDVPGQYQILQSDAELVRIDRFLPEVTLVRGHGYCHRRIHIRGHNGVVYPFIVQQPLPRQSRREERMLQMFRIFDRMLDTQRESRRRELSFTLPIIVPFAPQLRIVQDDPTYFSLQEVYEDYARRQGFPRDAPISYYTEHLKHIDETHRHKNEYLNLKMDIIERIGTTYVPSVLLRDYVLRFTPTYADFWLFRKQFTSQLAAMTFMTYISSSGHRYPHKIHVSRGGGSVWTAEMVPTWTSQNPVFANIESVPFRLTPNLQTFIQPVGMEGGFVGSLVAIARSLVEPEDEMRDYLSIFIRDELHNWQTAHHKSLDQVALWEKVNQNIQAIMTKAEALSCQNDRARGADKVVPACQTVLDLMSHATNPEILARMDCIWMPWL